MKLVFRKENENLSMKELSKSIPCFSFWMPDMPAFRLSAPRDNRCWYRKILGKQHVALKYKTDYYILQSVFDYHKERKKIMSCRTYFLFLTWCMGAACTFGSFIVRPRSQAPLFLMIGIICLIAAILWTCYVFRGRKSPKSVAIENEKTQRRDCLAVFYDECVKNNIYNCNLEKGKQKADLIARKHGITYTDIGTLFNEAKQCWQEKNKIVEESERQKELAELKEKEREQYNTLNEFSSYRGREKRIAMLTKDYDDTVKNLRVLNDAISMTLLPPMEKGSDWAVLGGIANGLAGTGAGIATALNAQMENARIEARNNTFLRETADIRGRMVVAGAEKRDALEARRLELDATISATKIKLIGKDTPNACLSALQFDGTNLAVSKTGTCIVNTNVKLKQSEYYIFDDVKATIDGTIQAEIYDGNSKIGTANLVLPLNGVPDDNMVAVKGMCLFCGQPGKHYSVKFNAENLWAIEQ